jgi:hypothetical protein
MPRYAWQKPKLTLLAIALISLTACGDLASNPGAGSCAGLPLRIYDAAFSARLADEVAAAPTVATWPKVVADYVLLRDEVRACQGER